MRRRWWLLGLSALGMVVGAVWFFQGVGAIKGSFMTGQPVWSVIGVVLVALAVRLAWAEVRRTPRP